MACSYTAVWVATWIVQTAVWCAQLSLLMTSKDLFVQAELSAGVALLHCCRMQYIGDVRPGQ